MVRTAPGTESAGLPTVRSTSLLGGLAADRFGAPVTIRVGAIVCILSAGWFAYMLPAVRKVVRPIYVERGIIAAPPEVDPTET